jgi:hypothetical protein
MGRKVVMRFLKRRNSITAAKLRIGVGLNDC